MYSTLEVCMSLNIEIFVLLKMLRPGSKKNKSFHQITVPV